jgi:hypothetical protein
MPGEFRVDGDRVAAGLEHLQRPEVSPASGGGVRDAAEDRSPTLRLR